MEGRHLLHSRLTDASAGAADQAGSFRGLRTMRPGLRSEQRRRYCAGNRRPSSAPSDGVRSLPRREVCRPFTWDNPAMETGGAQAQSGHSAGNAFIGGAIAFYARFDTVTLGVTTALAILFNPLVVFHRRRGRHHHHQLRVLHVGGPRMGSWATGPGKRVEARLEKFRSGRIMRHPVEWVTRGTVWFALAAALVNAISVTVAARVVGGKPIGARRITIGAVAYGTFFAGVYTLIGWGARELL